MGTLSGDGYYQDLDEDRWADDEAARDLREHEQDAMARRFNLAAQAKVGDTIQCACCGRQLIKTNYQQKFCPPKGKTHKRYVCKDRYHNIINPRGYFGHLG